MENQLAERRRGERFTAGIKILRDRENEVFPRIWSAKTFTNYVDAMKQSNLHITGEDDNLMK